MRLDQLTLTNFRGFESLDIRFHPELTVIVGANMAGKSALLDGTAIALAEYVAGASGDALDDLRPFRPTDPRRVTRVVEGVPDFEPRGEVRVVARGVIRGSEEEWSRDLESRLFGGFRQAMRAIYSGVLTSLAESLPLVAVYGTQRVWRPAEAEYPVGVGHRRDGYKGALDIGATHQGLASWMLKQTLVQLQRGQGYVQPQLAAVEAAVCACIGGVTRFWYDVQYDELRLERCGGDLQSFGMLSDGYRNMVALVADLAWRAAVLNPQYASEAHLKVEGVAIIDEVELHLHPGWQRRVLDDLRRTFPKVQFIVTTHSPQVVASVKGSQVRVLDNNRLIRADMYTEGRDSNEILEDIFGVPARPPEAQAELDDLYKLIEAEDFATARAKLAALEQRFGPDDAQIVRARWILDTEDADRTPPRAAAT